MKAMTTTIIEKPKTLRQLAVLYRKSKASYKNISASYKNISASYIQPNQPKKYVAQQGT